jgi:hypothetical protein
VLAFSDLAAIASAVGIIIVGIIIAVVMGFKAK